MKKLISGKRRFLRAVDRIVVEKDKSVSIGFKGEPDNYKLSEVRLDYVDGERGGLPGAEREILELVKGLLDKVENLEKKLVVFEVAKKQTADARLERIGLSAVRRLEEQIVLEGGYVDLDELEAILGVGKPAIAQRRRNHKLFALKKGDKNYQYPVFQFDGDKVMNGLLELLETLREKGLDGYHAVSYLLAKFDFLDGKRPLDLLREGTAEDLNLVLEHAQRFSEHGG